MLRTWSRNSCKLLQILLSCGEIFSRSQRGNHRVLRSLPLFLALVVSLHFHVSQARAFSAKALPYDQTCDTAARHASQETGVPLDVLMAITRTETGRLEGGATRPWPWTVNMEGRGLWFETRADALAYVFNHFKKGARSFDVGCFQINYRWHGAGFSSIEDMFDPLSNARYAAAFLKSLYGESGDWTTAAGTFHSRTASYADRYLVRFGSMLAELRPQEARPRSMDSIGYRPNRFPLLQKGQSAGLASLVPLASADAATPVIDFDLRRND